jgi:uncharacterized repeat protein (TIGR03803 family)
MLALILAVVVVRPAQAQTFSVIYSFTPEDGHSLTSLVLDKAGNLYGTTYQGGVGYGEVFKVDPSGHESILHSFGDNPDGAQPDASLTRDAAGNLYGTTCGGGLDYGTVFKLDASNNETILYSFTYPSPNYGTCPTGGLVRDSAGNLYGTTLYSGPASDQGVVFRLDADNNLTVLYGFTAGTDGAEPSGNLVRDSAGNLYGTARNGGDLSCFYMSSGCGVVFELVPTGSTYKYEGLHSFAGDPTDGKAPWAGLVDSAGNLYGTTVAGGSSLNCVDSGGCGVVFELTAAGKERILHTFTDGKDGAWPYAQLVRDPAGNLYGTAWNAGAGGFGVLFEINRSTGRYTVLHPFAGGNNDGANPYAGVVRDAAGNLYGTTYYGGTYGYGVIYKYTP